MNIIQPDVLLSECEFCNVNSISGLSYIENYKETCKNYTEIEIRKKIRKFEYEYSYFVCLDCAVFYSNKEDDLNELLYVIDKDKRDG